MPMIDRRPKLASLVVPAPGLMLSDGIRTPIPHTPMVGSPIVAPMVMTPDTPCFGHDLSSLCDEDGKNGYDMPFSEGEDELMRSYLSHPPRPLRHNYPPHSLPPPEALEELLLQLRISPQWPNNHSSMQTRARLLELARQRVAEYQSGPKRAPKAVYPMLSSRPSLSGSGQQRGQWAFMNNARTSGGFGMSRQGNSMDSLYGDSEPATFSEALRLSGNLQDNASQGLTNELSSVGALSSPLEFTFTFNPNAPPLASAPANMAAGGYFGHKPVVRPTSLLQRGRSFTGHDLANPLSSLSMSNEDSNSNDSFPSSPDEMIMAVEDGGHAIPRVGSPESEEGFMTSPPSSVSSSSADEDMTATLSTAAFPTRASGLSIDTRRSTTTLIQNFGTASVDATEQQPYTPLNPTFFSALTPNPVQHTPSGVSTPAITLTVDSPYNGGIDTPRLISSLNKASFRVETRDPEDFADGGSGSVSPTNTSHAFSQLSIAPRPVGNTTTTTTRNPPGAPIAQSRKTRITGTQTTLSRSLSEGMINLATSSGSHATSRSIPPMIISPSSSLNNLTTNSETNTIGDRHTIARPMVKRQKSNTPELSVFVPRPAGRITLDELRSPFEHKPAGAGSGGSVPSSGSNTPTGPGA